MQYHNFDCQICYSSYNQGERTPKVCPCGHTLCLCCLEQHLTNQPRCPLCRFDMHTFQEDPNLLKTNWTLKKMVGDLCPLHSELRTLVCITCKLEICSACVYVENTHDQHQIIHKTQIPLYLNQVKVQLWDIVDNQRWFHNAITLLLKHTRQSAINKLGKLEGVVDKRLKDAVLHETSLFFDMEEERANKTLERDFEVIVLIQEQIAALDNPEFNQESLEALGRQPGELDAEREYNLLLSNILNFNQFLNQTIESTLLLASIQPSDLSLVRPAVQNDQKSFFNIRKLLNFDFRCDSLLVTQKLPRTINSGTTNSNSLVSNKCLPYDQETLLIPFTDDQGPQEIAGATLRILNLLNKQSRALLNYLGHQMGQKTPLSLWSLKFWLQGVLIFEINLCGCQMTGEEMGSMFGKVLPQLKTVQEISLDFEKSQVADETLKKFEGAGDALKSLKKLKALKFNLTDTMATNKGVAWILDKVKEIGQEFSVNFGSEEIFSKDLDNFIQNALEDKNNFKGLATSFEVCILRNSADRRFAGQLVSKQVENPSGVLNLLDDETELNIMVEKYVHSSEESKLKLMIFKLSQESKSTGSSAASTTSC